VGGLAGAASLGRVRVRYPPGFNVTAAVMSVAVAWAPNSARPVQGDRVACPVKNAAIEEAIPVTAPTAPNTDDVQDALFKVPVLWTPTCSSERDIRSGVWVVELTRMAGLAGWSKGMPPFRG
jgi:hypothetical protein